MQSHDEGSCARERIARIENQRTIRLRIGLHTRRGGRLRGRVTRRLR
jgi:hypothetical protein